jgi:ElaB/YqjD/DUF883 family membrane-anchored ribosome-binding protein
MGRTKLKNKDKITMAEVRNRKESLKQEIRLLEGDFERRVNVLKSSVNDIRKPSLAIRKNPLKSVAITVVAGFTVGILRRKSRPGKKGNGTVTGRSSGLTSFIIDELQHIAAKKILEYLSELLDRQLTDYMNKPNSNQ